MDQDHFVHVASHDLREPLRQIAGLCAAVLRDYSDRLDERGCEYLIEAVGAAKRMGSLIEALEEYARAGAGAEVRTRFDTRDSLDQALQCLAEPIAVAGAVVTADELPSIVGPAPRFASLFQNLIGNAVKHAPAGPRPRIHVSAVRDGAFWRFSVSDNGAGIEQRLQAGIFEPFKRLAPADGVGGVGLGLSICRQIVEDMGGRIWVRSSPGDGATFIFTVEAVEEPVAAAAGRTIDIGGRPARLLLVEDSAGDVLLTRDALATAGIANPVRVARNGLEALDALRDGPQAPGADLILLDLTLPGMDGRELLRAVRADPQLRSVKVVVMSGFAGEPELMGSDGANAWLSKPLSIPQLEAVIREWPDFQVKDAAAPGSSAP